MATLPLAKTPHFFVFCLSFHVKYHIATANRVADDEQASRKIQRGPRRDDRRGRSAGASGGGRRQRKPERGRRYRPRYSCKKPAAFRRAAASRRNADGAKAPARRGRAARGSGSPQRQSPTRDPRGNSLVRDRAHG